MENVENYNTGETIRILKEIESLYRKDKSQLLGYISKIDTSNEEIYDIVSLIDSGKSPIKTIELKLDKLREDLGL